MPQLTRSQMIEVQLEADEILNEIFSGQTDQETLKRAADGLMKSLRSYDRGADFGRLVVREFYKRAGEQVGNC